MKKILKLLLPSMLLCAAPFRAEAESLESVWTEANNAFWNGEYEKAETLYERLETLGVRATELSYNLGTAYARRGELGKAVRHYERALRLDPGHEDTRHNLGVLREFLARRASEAGRDADLAPAAGPWRAILDRFSPRAAALAFLIFHLALFGVLIIRKFVYAEMPRLSLGVLAGVLAILTVATASVAVGKWYQERFEKEAVVVREGQLDVMEGPASEVKRFAIEEGSRVTLLDETDTWYKLLDIEGRDGWVPKAALGEI